MKKSITIFLVLLLIVSLISGCKDNDIAEKPANQGDSTKEPAAAQAGGIAMITNGDTINDHAFNSMMWQGLASAGGRLGFEPAFIEETGFSDEELLGGITALYNNGNRLIFCPGMSLIGAMNEARQMYSDLKFVMVDAVADPFPNVASTSFAVEQAGFLAGVASAVELSDAEFGFIGGMEIPSVQKYNWGFQQGLAFSNNAYGTSASIREENVIYSGSFGDFMGGKSLAANMYGNGVDAILVAAGHTGSGVIEYAKENVSGNTAWIICVDFDQYERGVYDGSNSVILTSAVKKYGAAAYELSNMYLNGNFPDSTEMRLDIMYDGVGIPDENPNLSQAALDAVKDATLKLKDGSITVFDYPDGLIP